MYKSVGIDDNDSEVALTDEQIKAAKKVYAAMRKCAKLGIEFSDFYGTLGCYNGNKIECYDMEENQYNKGREMREDEMYYELLKNFHPGCSDDTVYITLKE